MTHMHSILLALASCPLPIATLRLANDKGYVDVSKCETVVNKQMWGVWVDGRSATQGENAYGKQYNDEVMSSLRSIYELGLDGSNANLDIYLKVAGHLHQSWRRYWNPMHKEISQCHKEAMPQTVIKEIMSTVKVVDADYFPFRELTPRRYRDSLRKLFADYASEVSEYPGREAELFSIAKLMQNLAFLHPLGDGNGRSRLILLQYMLRQRKLGCGTMMYNNNKNIYFSTASNYAKSLDEGVKIYDKASNSKFSMNPWQTEEVRSSHTILFPPPQYMTELQQCWQKQLTPESRGTTAEMITINGTSTVQ